MPLTNCARCKKLFNKATVVAICPECEPDESADVEKVREVIKCEPDLNIEEAAARAEVGIGVVKRMLELGALARFDPNEKVHCGKCGAPAISASKRLCQACLDRLNLEVAEAQRSLQQSLPAPVKTDKGSSRLNVRRKIEDRFR